MRPLHAHVPRVVVSWAVDRRATVDYTVARAVHFVYEHNLLAQIVPLPFHKGCCKTPRWGGVPTPESQ